MTARHLNPIDRQEYPQNCADSEFHAMNENVVKNNLGNHCSSNPQTVGDQYRKMKRSSTILTAYFQLPADQAHLDHSNNTIERTREPQAT